MINRLTVLYDAGCGLCRRARTWLASRTQLVALEFVPAGSAEARRRFPALDVAQTLTDITVVADDGGVYTGDSAWLICLWALDSYRGLSLRLAEPDLLPTARRVIAAAAAVRRGTTATAGSLAEPDGYGAPCGGQCDI